MWHTTQPMEETIGGLRVIAEPLTFEQSQPLIAEIGMILSISFNRLAPLLASGSVKLDDNVDKLIPLLMPVIGEMSAHLNDGDRLVRLAPKILASTSVVVETLKGDLEKKSLGVAKDRSEVFNDRPDLFFPILFFAGRRTFTRFFPGRGRSGGSTPAASR